MENKNYQTPAPEEDIFFEEYGSPEKSTGPQCCGDSVDNLPQPSAPKRGLPKKVLIPLIAGVGALITVLIVLLTGGKNTYTTPLDFEIAAMNAKNYFTYVDINLSFTNGILDKEVLSLHDIMKKHGIDYICIGQDTFDQIVENCEYEYGNDYKFYYKITDKYKYDKGDLVNVQEDLIENVVDARNDMAYADDEDFRDLGISKSEAQKCINAYKSILKKLKSIEITEGYELEVQFLVKGDELTEPEIIRQDTVSVFKINGRWVNIERLREFIPY